MRISTLFLLLAFSVIADPAIVDFRTLKDSVVYVDMMGPESAGVKDGVDIFLHSDREPETVIVDGPLAHCRLDSIGHIGRKSYHLSVAFDPILDDGANGCSVLVITSSRVRRVNLSIFIDG